MNEINNVVVTVYSNGIIMIADISTIIYSRFVVGHWTQERIISTEVSTVMRQRPRRTIYYNCLLVLL